MAACSSVVLGFGCFTWGDLSFSLCLDLVVDELRKRWVRGCDQVLLRQLSLTGRVVGPEGDSRRPERRLLKRLINTTRLNRLILP